MNYWRLPHDCSFCMKLLLKVYSVMHGRGICAWSVVHVTGIHAMYTGICTIYCCSIWRKLLKSTFDTYLNRDLFQGRGYGNNWTIGEGVQTISKYGGVWGLKGKLIGWYELVWKGVTPTSSNQNICCIHAYRHVYKLMGSFQYKPMCTALFLTYRRPQHMALRGTKVFFPVAPYGSPQD